MLQSGCNQSFIDLCQAFVDLIFNGKIMAWVFLVHKNRFLPAFRLQNTQTSVGGGFSLQDAGWALLFEKPPSLVPEEHCKMAVHIDKRHKIWARGLSLNKVTVPGCP